MMCYHIKEMPTVKVTDMKFQQISQLNVFHFVEKNFVDFSS